MPRFGEKNPLVRKLVAIKVAHDAEHARIRELPPGEQVAPLAVDAAFHAKSAKKKRGFARVVKSISRETRRATKNIKRETTRATKEVKRTTEKVEAEVKRVPRNVKKLRDTVKGLAGKLLGAGRALLLIPLAIVVFIVIRAVR